MPRILLPWPALVAPTILLSVVLTSVAAGTTTSNSIGVNWGTQMSHPVHPKIVVKMLQDNGITKVKLFDADQWTMSALVGSGIDVMVAIPNDQLERMSEDYDNARDWVKENVTAYDRKGGVRIKYVAVGNEPFLQSYNGSFLNTTLPSLKNIQRALDESGAGDRIKATVPLNADVYGSPAEKPVPSAGAFRADIGGLMVEMVRFLDAHKAPFVVNIYPFLSLYQNPHFPVDFAFFDGFDRPVKDRNNVRYTNMFDANYDTLVYALRKAGVDDMKIIVGEAGWPTDGNKNANIAYARKFYAGLLRKLANDKGTPLRPGSIEVYLFGVIDENMKSIAPGAFERHWGIFTYDGKPKFPMDLSGRGRNSTYLAGAKGIEYMQAQWCVFNKDAKLDPALMKSQVNYACSNADCTPLGPGSSCAQLDPQSRSSYGFNIYFQMASQDVRACDFGGFAKITTANASEGGCLFPVQIVSDGERTLASSMLMLVMVMGVLMLMLVMEM